MMSKIFLLCFTLPKLEDFAYGSVHLHRQRKNILFILKMVINPLKSDVRFWMSDISFRRSSRKFWEILGLLIFISHSPWTSSNVSSGLPEVESPPTVPSSQILFSLRQDSCTIVRRYILSIASSKFHPYLLYIPSKKYTSKLKTFAMAAIFDLLSNGANINAFKVFFPNCVLVASICVSVALWEVSSLDTALSNFTPKRWAGAFEV